MTTILKIHDTLGKVIFQTKRGLNVSRWSDRLIQLPKWLSSPVLKSVDMSGVDMRDTAFDDATLVDVNFYRSILNATNWISSELEDVNFTRSNMAASQFYRGKITGVDFALADLRGSEFTNVEIYDSYFSMANLRGVEFTMPERFIENMVTTCSFENAKLEGCTINDKPILEWINKYNQD